MFRKRRDDGRLEPPTRFAERKYHDHKCYGMALLRRRLTSGRECIQCSEPIVRKRFGRYYEPMKQFRRRQCCKRECWLLWVSDPLNAIAYGARIQATRNENRRMAIESAAKHRAAQARYAARKQEAA